MPPDEGEPMPMIVLPRYVVLTCFLLTALYPFISWRLRTPTLSVIPTLAFCVTKSRTNTRRLATKMREQVGETSHRDEYQKPASWREREAKIMRLRVQALITWAAVHLNDVRSSRAAQIAMVATPAFTILC